MRDWSKNVSDSIQFLCLDFESLNNEVHSINYAVLYKMLLF